MYKYLVIFFLSIFSAGIGLAQCTADAGPDVGYCIGSSAQIGNNSPGNPGTTTYSWAPTVGLSCSTCPNPTVSAATSGFYVLTVTDIPSNCVQIDTVFVAVNTYPTASFVFAPGPICANVPVTFTNTSTGVSPTFNWTFTDPTSGTNTTSTDTSTVHAFTAVGNATQYSYINLDVTSNGCTTSHFDSILINQAPDAVLIDPIDNFINCAGGIFSLTVYDASTPVPNTHYQIIWGDGSVDYDSVAFPAAGVSHIYANSGVYNLTYIVTGVNGCTDTTTYLTANILNPSIGSANPGGTTGCAPLTLCFPLNNWMTNPVSTIYKVDFGDGSPVTIYTHPPPDSVCHTYTASSCGLPGDQYVFEIKAVNACDSSSASVSPIRIYTGPEADFIPSAMAGCTNVPITMINTTIPGFGGNCTNTTIFNWDFGDGNTLVTISNVDPAHTYLLPGTYTVTLTTSNSCGPTSMSHDVCIEDPLVINASADANDGCAPLIVNFNDSTDFSLSCDTVRLWTVSYNGSTCMPNTSAFNFIGGTSATSISPQIQFLNSGNYIVTLTVTNSCGVQTQNFPITVRDVPEITVTPIGPFCVNLPVNLNATAISCLDPITGYVWTFPGATPGSSTLLNPNNILYPVAGTYAVQLDVSNGCGTATQTANINVTPTPASLNPLVNSPICETFSANFTSDLTPGITYNWSGPGGYTNTNQNFTLPSTLPSQSGWYQVYADLNGCPGSADSVNLIVNPLPTVNAGGNINLCLDNAPLQINGIPAGGTWTGAGITPGGMFTAATAGIGAHNLTYIYTDPTTSCTDSSMKIITVVPLPIVDAGVDTTLCDQPIPVQFNGLPAGGTWTGPNISLTGLFTPNGLGTYTVTYSYVNANSCIGTDTKDIIVSNGIPPNAGSDSIICQNDPVVNFVATPLGGSWSGPFTTVSGAFTPSTAGVYDIIYTTGAGNCLAVDSLVATVNALPTVVAGVNQTVCIDAGPINLAGFPAGGTWTGAGVTNPTGTVDPQIANVGSHVLTYDYTDPTTGCSSNSTLTLTVNALPIVDAGVDTLLCNQPIGAQMIGSPVGGTWSGPNITPTGIFTPAGVGVSTVTYSFTDGNGCTITDSKDITVSNPVQGNAGLDTSECINGPIVQLTGSPAGGVWGGAFVNPSGAFTPSTAGSHVVTYYYGSGNCLTTDNLIVTVHPLPAPNAGPDEDFCVNGTPTNLAANPSGGTWSGVGITNMNLGTFDPSVALVGTFDIVYLYADPITSCANTDTLIANVHPLPTPSFTFPPVGCLNAPVAFTNTTIGSATQTWNFGDGGTSPGFSPNHTYTSTGFFNVQLISTSAFGCIDSITQIIEIHSIPVANFTSTPDTACSPVNATFTNLSTGPNMSYNWDFGNGQTSTLMNPAGQVFTQGLTTDTTYTIFLTVSNLCGSTNHTQTVTALPSPVASFGIPNNTGCSPFVTNFINNSVGISNTYLWDFGDGTTSTSGAATFQHTFTAGATDTVYNISLVVTNQCGTDTATDSIHVFPNTVTAFFNSSTLAGCGPLTVDFTQFSIGGTNFNWDFGDGNVSAVTHPTHVYSLPGTYQVSLIVSDGCGVDTAFATIDVFPSPVVTLSATPLIVCINEPIQFNNTSVGLSSTDWDFGDGNISSLNNPIHSYATSGNYYVSLTGTSNGNGCPTTDSLLVTVDTNPVANFIPSPNQGCEDLDVNLINGSTNSSYYAWDFDDGNLSSTISPSHTYTQAGTYSASLVVTNLNGCKDSVIETITVHPIPVSDFSFTTSNPCVVPGTANFTNLSTGANNYQWDFGNTFTSTFTNPNTTYSVVGTYPVSLISTNVFGCADTIVKEVSFYDKATAQFDISQDSVCEGESITFTSNSSEYDSLIWNFGNGNVFSSTSVDITFPVSGNYPINLIAYTGGGCNDTAAIAANITVMPLPVADFGCVNVQLPDPAAGTVDFTNLSSNADYYLWQFGDGSTATNENPSYNYLHFGEYKVELFASTEFGCVDSTSKIALVSFPHGLYIPTAIHPENVDYELSHFIPKGLGLMEYEILIFDDWGNLIWSSTALDADGRPTEVWDGTFKGQKVQQDAYVWKVKAVFYGGEVWEGNDIGQGKAKRSGTITVLH